jgi:rhodanese-related sulfurtransferase
VKAFQTTTTTTTTTFQYFSIEKKETKPFAFQVTAFSSPGLSNLTQKNLNMSPSADKGKKPGVASLEEIAKFVEEAGDKLLVVDVRNPDFTKEPGDERSLALTGLPTPETCPQAVSLIWDKDTDSMPLPDISRDTPIITHCGAGARGQKAKVYLQENGFKNVINGGGPRTLVCHRPYP